MRILLPLLVFIVIWQTTSFSQSVPTTEMDKIVEGKIDENAPGIAVGIIKNGEIIYEKYIGYANLEHQIKADERTRFNIASVAKQFTALCVLDLIQAGKLQLTDDFRKHLPDFYPNIKEKITIAHLITHTSGIRDFYDLMSMQGKPWWAETGLDNNDALKILAAQKSLNFSPGEKYEYSNSGYILLTAIVEKESGVTFAEYASDLFERLNMPNTHYVTNYMAVIPQKALPYTNWGDGQWQQYPYVVDLHGDGFLFTTLKDQLEYEQSIQGLRSGVHPSRELSESLKKLLELSQKTVAGSEIDNYGYGLELDQYRGLKRIQHSGGTGSYSAQTTRFPKENLSVVVISNNGNVWTTGLANELINLLLADLPMAIGTSAEPADAGTPDDVGIQSALHEITGRYRSEDDGLIDIIEQDQELVWQVYNQNQMNLIHQKGNLYNARQNPRMQVLFDASAKTFTVYYPGSTPRVHEKIKTPQLSKEAYEAINGQYYNDELEVTFSLTHQDGNAYSMQVRGRTFDAILLIENRIRMGDYTLNLHKKEGEIDEILVDYGRNVNIRFIKQ